MRKTFHPKITVTVSAANISYELSYPSLLLLLCPSVRDFRSRLAIGPTFYLLYVGEKSDDPLSPAYVPRIFSFTTSAEKQVAEQSVKRYESRKRREETNGSDSVLEEAADVPVADVPDVADGSFPCMSTQTELSANANDIAISEHGYQLQTRVSMANATRYPTQYNLKVDEKLLRFYTGLSRFKTLMAVFEIVLSSLPKPNIKTYQL